ncbi:MAG TPA: hypothetical protein VFG42_11295 [Baekduia sp.]|uniref:hypothetical protein n=1 Tax=Baekduia sp. TaxID=2600305 RepID=UPI002D776DD6|nr:hypothetical protein [Baekduia sp.]HET6507362.1 hypothetical protein [Baekduia sp.]
MERRLAPHVLVPIALAVVVWLVALPARFVNYDTAYATVWGNDLLHGRVPDYDVPFAPTPHPLAMVVGMLGSLGVFEVLAFLALGVLGWLTFELGRAWFNGPTGVLAAAIVLTREPVFSYGVRAYVDIPYICFLLGALLIETRRPRAGTWPLVLIALAGLLRPEAWLFAFAYCVWLWRGGALTRTHVALLVSAPLLWCLSDLLITGNPIHSLTGTRDTAADLGRITGLRHVPSTLPRRLGEILREPVLLGAAIGGVLSLWRLRDRRGVLLGAAAGVIAIVAFCVLAAAGLSILTRYLLLPATILAIFAAAGVFGWLELGRTDPWRRRWIAGAALTAVALLAFVPSQVSRLHATRAALVTQTKILDELHELAPHARCPTLSVPNRRAVPQLALWTDRPPRDIVSAQEAGRYTGSAFVPASPAIADQFVLDARDKDKTLPPAPPVRASVFGRYWTLYDTCA